MRHIRLYAATGTAVAALALTACGGGGTGTKDEGAARPQPTTAAKATTDGGTSAEAGSAPGHATSVSARTSATKQKGTQPKGAQPKSTALHPCNGSNTKVTAAPVSRPLNHLLLTAKNTSGKSCDLLYWPTPRFDDAQWAPEVIKDSQPQAVVTLAPGESGYAGVRLSAADGSGQNGTTAHKLEVYFAGSTPGSNSAPSAHPALTAKGVYYDSTLAMTYWQSSASDALTW
ncbi:DUF4232 domain-containing protein [Streptomyces sp. LP11]|uniref:DUF4232 domain-containing protein n=1 Tax=Streptomyces pyxinicus TaxID=2970331 RepID=A0ABT2B2Q6_9ACTN|nr:DUF4232 domain-containing protein [Streptomyces sp. LP11]MCS0602809.1 DUF4232 domain-containing protein [Streptomyces sp. LP11]